MFTLNFRIPYNYVSKLEEYLDSIEIYNVTIFENTDLGFSEVGLDNNGFPIANFFNVEIFGKDEEECCVTKEKILSNKELSQYIDNITISIINNDDWVDMYIRELKPIIIDNFYIYNDNYTDIPEDARNLTPIKINSALAFGSGDHQTTQACISMMNYIKNNINSFKPKNILDMGCGSGILAISSSKIWDDIENIVGIDIEEDAVNITRDNFSINDVQNTKVFHGSNLDVVDHEKFDLVLCNILKQPLQDLCPHFFSHMNENSYIITSGFITSQYDDVRSTYLSHGFTEIHKIQINDWLSVLFMKK